jgi:hypothetical protein
MGRPKRERYPEIISFRAEKGTKLQIKKLQQSGEEPSDTKRRIFARGLSVYMEKKRP